MFLRDCHPMVGHLAFGAWVSLVIGSRELELRWVVVPGELMQLKFAMSPAKHLDGKLEPGFSPG